MSRQFLLILLGASLWGTIGWFVKNLYNYGFTPMEVVTLRVVTTAIFLLVFFGLTNSSLLRLKKVSDLKFFLGTGIVSIVFFNYCLFTAIQKSTIPVATALLYTAPAFVMFFSILLFSESWTRYKLISLVATLLGTSLVAGVFTNLPGSFNSIAIWFGIGSGLGYALYSIFSKYALEKYTSSTVTIYTFLIASLALLPFFPFLEKGKVLLNPEVLFYAFGLGIIPTGLAYLLYTYGLYYVEASKAAILSTAEPVVATFIGIFIFNESFTLFQGLGMSLILMAVIIINVRSEKNLNQESIH